MGKVWAWRLAFTAFLATYAVAITGTWARSLPLVWGGTAAMGVAMVAMAILLRRPG